MENINIIKNCCGCGNCSLNCPKNAISMVYDDEGFLKPVINLNECIDCGICLKSCSNYNDYSKNNYKKKYLGFINDNKDEIIKSSSGGFAFFISKFFIDNGGYVCGCVFDDNLNAIHIVSNKIDDIKKMCFSKYVQSNLAKVFVEIKKLLNTNKNVLFIGTPCQVHALNLFLKKDFSNLFTIDLICHGVPSPILFKNYIVYLSNKKKSKVKAYCFRYKKNNKWGGNYYCKIDYENGKKEIKPLYLDKYGNDFIGAKNYRESCYECRFSSIENRPADLTIGDFWGIFGSNHKKNYNHGASSIIINSKKGEKIIDSIYDNNFFECSETEILEKQNNLKKPTPRPKCRNTYYKNLNNNFFEKKLIILNFKEVLKLIIPYNIRKIMKKIFK